MAKRKTMRPTWEGHLRLSLVTCPVALYSATERSADVHFNMINPKTNNRIRMQAVDAAMIAAKTHAASLFGPAE